MENSDKKEELEKKEAQEESPKEERIRAITRLYYSNPRIIEAIAKFSLDREVVPRYFESFGKRPDKIQYPSDVMGLVNKGATSFHASEEIWEDPLSLNSEMTQEEMANLRKSWDLLIDVDSPFLDCSKIAAKLIIAALEQHGIKNYGIKFSVSGDTPVLVKIREDIALMSVKESIERLKKGEKMKILSINRKKKLVFSEVYDCLEHEADIYEIMHEQSKVPLKATSHHSIFTFEGGRILQKKVSEVKPGDYLITYNSRINPFVLKKEYLVNKYQFGKNQYSKKNITKRIKITRQLMRLIGYYLAEGHITNRINQVGFSFNVKEGDYIEDCIKMLKEITGKQPSIRHPNKGSTQILIHSKEWSSFFEKLCGKSKGKHLPDFAWTISKEYFEEMLKGYMRGDGYKAGEYSLVAKSVALKLIKELVWLCKLHGISCSLSHEKNKPHKLPQGNFFKGSFVYIIKINKSEIGLDEFNRKRNKFSPYPRDRTFPIDGLKQVYEQIKPKLFNKHRAEQMTLKKQRANLGRIRKVMEWFNKYKEMDFDEPSRKIMADYRSLFDSDVGVVKIKSIKKTSKDKVYDVSVKDTEAFFGNDYPILLHNSGSKGFHIIISGKAFPSEYDGLEMRKMFPEWPRAISEYLMSWIRPAYNKEVGRMLTEEEIMKRTNIKEDELKSVHCTLCNRSAKKGLIVSLVCPVCGLRMERRDAKMTKRRLKCLNENCAGELEVEQHENEREYYYCDYCRDPENKNVQLSSDKYPDNFEVMEGINAEKVANLDLVLVAPRHLFRMPYSLHEKTALASIVLRKEQIETFSPRDANPLGVKIVNFLPENEVGEARSLLSAALEWKKNKNSDEEKGISKRYESYEKLDLKGVGEDMFPAPIKKLLKGLKDGKKRGLFILLTFLKSTGFNPDYINSKIREWNKLNEPPLKEGYVRSQIDWHLRQKKSILPPNYDNPAFYKDLNLLDEKPDVKNPIVEVMRKVRRKG